MSTTHRSIRLADTVANTRRGGDIRVLLGPATVGSTSGFMGVTIIEPGEVVAEHYHPYSEEFLYVTAGTLVVDLDGVPTTLRPDDAVFVPINTRHRLRNPGTEQVRAVFHLSPLAPAPPLGHVDTESAEDAVRFVASKA